MKYIDADKLRAEIERRIKIHNELSEKPVMSDLKLELQMVDGNLRGIISFIDSLQQEQQTDKQVVVITESHGDANIEWDCRSIDDVKELLAAGARYVSKEREQPETDLEEKINRFWDSCIKHKNERGGNVIWSNKIEIEALARHFFELGLNARKP